MKTDRKSNSVGDENSSDKCLTMAPCAVRPATATAIQPIPYSRSVNVESSRPRTSGGVTVNHPWEIDGVIAEIAKLKRLSAL